MEGGITGKTLDLILKFVFGSAILMLFFSPSASQEIGTVNRMAGTAGNTPASDTSSVIRYDVYEEGPENEINSFNLVMADDPITAKMNRELDIVTNTHSANVFFSSYVTIWKDELDFSIENLKTYLTEEDSLKLEEAQSAWDNSRALNRELDSSLIGNNGILLGAQSYVTNSLLYEIAQYRERVFHIKYMTNLAETSVVKAVPRQDQLWDQFHDFE